MNSMMLMNTIFPRLGSEKRFRTCDAIKGIAMKRTMYLNISRGLTAEPKNAQVIRGVRASAEMYMALVIRTVALVSPLR